MAKGTKKAKKSPVAVVVQSVRVAETYVANQWTPPDPRQDLFWSFYKDPKSLTFSNAKQSALKAGYSEGYANQITAQPWFVEISRRHGLLGLAEIALEEAVTVEVNVPVMGMFGPVIDPKTKLPLQKVSPELLRTKLEAGKFIASTQGRNKGYSTKHEVEIKVLPVPILGGIAEADIQKPNETTKK